MMRICFIIFVLFIQIQVFSQIKAVTEKGDTIIINDNGTWEKLNKPKTVENIETDVKAYAEVDEFTKTRRIQTETWRFFGKNKIGATITGNLIRTEKIAGFSIMYTGDLGCLSEYNSTMKVKLTNGDIVEFSQASKTDCGSYQSALFVPITRDELKSPDYISIIENNLYLLKNYDWETIRLHGSEYYTDLTPNVSRKIEKPEQFFRQHLIAADRE